MQDKYPKFLIGSSTRGDLFLLTGLSACIDRADRSRQSQQGLSAKFWRNTYSPPPLGYDITWSRSFQLVSELWSPDWSLTAWRITMSTFCEVPFVPLGINGSNYISWSAHIRNMLRNMGPSFEQDIKTSILPKGFKNLSNEEKGMFVV